VIFEDGGYWCRAGNHSGWLDDDNPRHITTEEQSALRLLKIERKQRETEKRLTALERMHRCTDHITYHNQMDQDDRNYWHSQGILDRAIEQYKLGLCLSCPTDSEHRPSWTIPVMHGGKLVNIRHRIIGADGGDKYRPHMAGLGNTLFNADNLYKPDIDTIMIVEGEKKSIVLSQYGIDTVGIMGKSSFPPAWAQRFERFRQVLVCLDPDAAERARGIAKLFTGRGYVVTLPTKPDDFFVMGGDARDFEEFMRLAWRAD